MHASNGKLHDVHALDLLELEAGAIYVMERGYVDFARLHALHLDASPCRGCPGTKCSQTYALWYRGHFLAVSPDR